MLKSIFKSAFNPSHKPEPKQSAPVPDVRSFMLGYKIMYYSKNVTRDELVDYACCFGYSKSTVVSTVDKYISDGSIMQAGGTDLLPLLKVDELKALLRDFDLNVRGKKADLVDRLKENVSRTDLEKRLPKTKKLIRSAKGEEVYKNMLALREEMRELLYSQTLNLCRNRNFTAAQNRACLYIQTSSPSYSLKFLYDSQEFSQVMLTLGAERGAVAIADLLCQTRGADVSAAYSIIHITKMKQENVKFYNILADKASCPVCKKFDGKKLRVSKAQLGVNLPPLHDGCRCCICEAD